jgi:4-hydroxy-tetrahydrodipicolinate reductase
MKKIGIVGNSGRMGNLLASAIENHKHFSLGAGFSRNQQPYIPLEKVFEENDCIIDFAKGDFVEKLLKTAIASPKPIIICSTGWHYARVAHLINELSKKIPLVIASNTSIGAYLQRQLAKKLAEFLDEEFDIDVIEKHHRHKVDIPSGTANTLIKDIQTAKLQKFGLEYKAEILANSGERPNNLIGLAVLRSGNLFGDHEITFTSSEEMISIRHVAMSRALFAKGAIKIAEWLENSKPTPGIYSVEDIFQ